MSEGIADVGETRQCTSRWRACISVGSASAASPMIHQRHLDRIAGLCVTFEFFEAHAVDPGADESDVVQDVPKPPRGIFAGHLENADRVARGAHARKWLQPSRRDQIDRAADDLG